MDANDETQPPAQTRRGFIKESCALIAGGAAGLAPLAAGLGVFLDPLRRGATAGAGSLYVAPLSALPAGGEPQKFPVLATREDAWNRSPNTPVGAVYLLRKGERAAVAFNAMCPHAGCFLDYNAPQRCFHCPCHDSRFALDGARSDASSPSPRGMDELAAEVRDDGEVWVKFRNFRAGDKDKIPVG